MTTIRKKLLLAKETLDATPCSFEFCDGPNRRYQHMKTCSVCQANQAIRQALRLMEKDDEKNKRRGTPYGLKPLEASPGMSLKQKREILKDFKAFILSSFERNLLTDRLYIFLVMHCTLASYSSKADFYSHYFDGPYPGAAFLKQFKTGIHLIYGTTAWTLSSYRDVKKYMRVYAQYYLY